MNSSTPNKPLTLAMLVLDVVSVYALCKRVVSRAKDLRPESRHLHLK